jgi:type I restriction enzyme, S subunit
MSLIRYPQYKDNGVAWLGDVPAHWHVRRLKWLIERNDGGVWGEDPDGEDDTVVLRSTEQSVDGRWQIAEPALRKLTANERKLALLESGDLLVTKSSGSSLHIGKTTLVDDEVAALSCCYSNFMQRLRLRDFFLPKLAWYVMNSELARLQFDLLSNSTTGLANLNGSVIGEVLVAVAPLSEQVAVTAFLDRETGKIDALIAEQEKLLALLAEKRQAAISHAVTRGLNPEALMKDSGVESFGDIPKHWRPTRLKLLFRLQKRQGFAEKEVLSVYRDFGVVRKDSRTDNFNKTPEDLSAYQLVQGGDLVVNKMKAWQGSLGVSSLEGITSPDYVVFEPRHEEVPEYLHYLLRAKAMVGMYRSISNGIRLAQWRLEPDAFLSLRVFLPPVDEQREIAEYIYSEVSKIDSLMENAEKVIGLLGERRGALIAAAVTGKIDVRHAVPKELAA